MQLSASYRWSSVRMNSTLGCLTLSSDIGAAKVSDDENTDVITQAINAKNFFMAMFRINYVTETLYHPSKSAGCVLEI